MTGELVERNRRREEKGWEVQTFATPRFSMAGILCPVVLVYDINGARSRQSVVSALFSLSDAPLRSSSRSLRGLR